ncbi:helix-turn-helix domain-containing protein [Candidatus Bathyarchaeota archaeon]|nr:helix-turn-helix domain-containing protein [Candidatus Bathyarchaeota archaeon]
MPRTRSKRSVKVLKAVSSPLRLKILNFLFDSGSLSYTELMKSLKMNPSRDAGRFAYHLKSLLKADLVEVDIESKKYCLTDLGKMLIEITEKVEKKAQKRKEKIVRTSQFTIEEFDANKIANSLIKEAKIPFELAQKTAKTAEKRLLKSKIQYLTAPLVREVVNTILIENGLEEYRHKLARLGLPVHEVTKFLDTKTKTPLNSHAIISRAGKTVLREYTLFKVFPRDITDAHLSGALNIDDLDTWILKPSEVMHDLRFFLQNGIRLEKMNAFHLSEKPPQTLESALAMTSNLLLHTSKEVNKMQTLDNFNVFLAPLVKGFEIGRIKKALRRFILNANQHAELTICLEIPMSNIVAEKPVVGHGGDKRDRYQDFTKESQLIASLLIEILADLTSTKPLPNPRLICKISNQTFLDEESKAILLEAHRLSSERGLPYFANMNLKKKKRAVFSATGCKLESDLGDDWEIETLRTGCLGQVDLNLPRIAIESNKDKNRFFEILRERIELVIRALEIKYRNLRSRGKNLNPFLMQSTNGDTYFRLEQCTRIMNLVGFQEAVRAFCAKNLKNEDPLGFAEEILKNTLKFKRRIGRKSGKRLFPTILPNPEASKRLVQLDIEEYGIAKVSYSGTRENPFYSTTRRTHIQGENSFQFPLEQNEIEDMLNGLNGGGSLRVIELEDTEHSPENLMKLTRRLTEEQAIEFFIFNRNSTYCINCKRSWIGKKLRCPSCGSISTLRAFKKFNSS